MFSGRSSVLDPAGIGAAALPRTLPAVRAALTFTSFPDVIKSLVILFFCLIAAIVGAGPFWGFRIGPLLRGRWWVLANFPGLPEA